MFWGLVSDDPKILRISICTVPYYDGYITGLKILGQLFYVTFYADPYMFRWFISLTQKV